VPAARDSPRLALGWLVAAELRAHPARFLLTGLAIAVGVALGFAVHLVNRSALTAFEGAVRTVGGSADLSVRAASPLGFDERLYPAVARAAGVADASPVVALRARIGTTELPLLGLDVLRAVRVTPALVGVEASGRAPGAGLFAEDALFLSSAALAATGLRPGAIAEVRANGRRVALRVAGILPGAAADQPLAVTDIATVQWRFDRLGRLDRIDLRLAGGSAAGRTARAALTALLPPAARVTDAAAEADRGSAISRAYRVNLDMLALVALLTGGFLVFSAQSLSVVRRQRDFALLRTLGLSRRGVVAAIGLEGLVLGLAGALAGLALGAVLARLALDLLGGDLGAGYFGGGADRLVLAPGAMLGFLLLGIAAALAGSLVPARLAARAAPAAALKNAGDPLDPRAPVPWRPALALLVLGAGFAFAPPLGGLPVLGFVSMALLLAGGVAGVPWLARRLVGLIGRRPPRSVPVELALRHVAGAPLEAATALAGIVASTALMIAMATMVTSFRGAVDQWLGQVLAADLYLRSDGAPLGPDAQRRLAAVPGIAGIAFSRQLPLVVAPDRPPVWLIARPLAPGPAAAPLVLTDRADALPPGLPRAYVSEPAQRLYGWDPGEVITLPLGTGARFAVAGVWRDYARQAGAVAIDAGAYTRLTGDATREEAAIALAPGADRAAVRRALVAALPDALRPSVQLADPGTLRRFALQLFDRSFAVTYALEAVAVLVGLAGVAATMSGQTVARRREFGMLRHLGVSKRQILALLGIEGALLGLIGGLAGSALGLALSQVLIHVINPQSFNFTMATQVPVGTIAAVQLALVVAAAGTAMVAARRATAGDAVLAVREDW
jgi:putative ABC transport system permease protein